MAKMGRHDVGIRSIASSGFSPLISYLVMVIILSHSALAFLAAPTNPHPQDRSLMSRATNGSSLLECLQVSAPVLSPGGCQQTLMVHTFAASYGQPFVGAYNPPSCSFNRVTINLTVTSAGRQFDRLGFMFLGDVEVFRTSTAEPTQNGIIWSYVKDMSPFLSLLKGPQKLIFDLGNLIDDTYTGSWNTTLTATFFTAEETADPADMIIPISARRSATDQTSTFIIPETKAVDTIQLPQNMKKAVVTISACGQAAEEFWWSNVLTSDTAAFGNQTLLYGHSAFRELQLLIDGQLAGVAWPFPVIFTGGIVPGFWRPIVGIDAFDLRDDEIDISPFIPLLSDGKDHTFEIRVVGVDDDGRGTGTLTQSIESNWPVTGKVFVWADESVKVSAGTFGAVRAPEPSIKLSSRRNGYSNGSAMSLQYSIEVSRDLYIESTIQTANGSKTVSWQQNLQFSNAGTLSNQGNDQDVSQTTTGNEKSSSGFLRKFEYPLWVISSYNVLSGGNFTITGKLGRGKYVDQLQELAFLNDWQTFDYTRLPSVPSDLASTRGSNLQNWQNGTASYLSVPAQKKSYGSGNTEQLYTLNRLVAADQSNHLLYRRKIIAQNDSIVYDDQVLGGQANDQVRIFSVGSPAIPEDTVHEFAGQSIRALIGRGPK